MLTIRRDRLESRGLFDEPAADAAAAGGPGGGDSVAGEAKPADPNALLASVIQQQERLTAGLAQLTEQVTRIAGTARPPETAVVQPDRISEDQFDEAVRVGDAKTIKAYMGQQMRELVEPRFAVMEQVGEDLATRAFTTDMPHFKRFEKEIRAFINTLPPAGRLNPQVHRLAYNAVVGQHYSELLNEELEKRARAGKHLEAVGAPNGGAGRGAAAGAGDDIPTPEKLFGAEAAKALEHRGMDADSFARKMGYKDWNAYAKLAQEQGY